MKVRFILTMDNLVVHGKPRGDLVIDCEDESSPDEIAGLAQRLLTSRNFLTEHMNGLSEVGESSLTIEPIGEPNI